MRTAAVRFWSQPGTRLRHLASRSRSRPRTSAHPVRESDPQLTSLHPTENAEGHEEGHVGEFGFRVRNVLDGSMMRSRHIHQWNMSLMEATTDERIMEALCALPPEALREPVVWNTIISVFKRHRIVDGLRWALNEMHEREMPITVECYGSLLSAWGHVGRPDLCVRLWESEPSLEVLPASALARLLSITAVALARNNVDFDAYVRRAFFIVQNEAASRIDARFTLGRCMHAFVLAGDLTMAVRTFKMYTRECFNLSKPIASTMVNVVLRGYCETDDLDTILRFYDLARSSVPRIVESDVLAARAVLRLRGAREAVELLRTYGDANGHPQAFVWLMWRLLERPETMDEARTVYALLCGAVTPVEVHAVVSSGVERSTMQKQFPEPLKTYELYHHGRPGALSSGEGSTEAPPAATIAWVNIVRRAPNARVLERFLAMGAARFTRLELTLLLRVCVAYGSVRGVGLLVSSRMNRGTKPLFWADGFGYDVMARLLNIRANAEAPRGGGPAVVAATHEAVHALTMELLRDFPPIDLHSQLLALACSWPIDMADRVKALLRNDAAFFREVAAKKFLFLVARVIISCGVFPHYCDALLPEMRKLDSLAHAKCMAALQQSGSVAVEFVDRAITSGTDKAQLLYWEQCLECAPDPKAIWGILKRAASVAPPLVVADLR